ncbi:DUF6773 family protein [Serpentinicella alkaliphila]|uniref:Uncharacterized protein n=1 Tax=Serpentinicella alkaliphila TaxID=1734049 RepID=A0A4R2T2P3_9FIRM|nr:DUF6773 family protein [Serpentinicella alkaliphila]QUH25862.1 hypothetical protein HZR23_09020 [Serpentinicella alkaliphila]TCP97179.1 hypothetical protein EDD79_10475 [Serpentinicella alkaliphila]
MNKNGLDEMQIMIKNKIGSQTFLLLMYLLLLDAGLFGFGFKWINYPANIMLIISFCSGIYVVRLISANAYIGPSNKKERPVLKVLLNMVIGTFSSIIIIIFLKNINTIDSQHIDEGTAPILFITAAIGILISSITAIIKRKQNKENEE